MSNTEPIRPARPLNLVAVRTVTGATTFVVTRHVSEQLAHLGTVLEIDERLILQTEHADEIVHRICADLDPHRLLTQEGRWFGVDWETVQRLIADFDPNTGFRIRLGDLSVGDTVWARLATADEPRLPRKGTVVGIVGRLYLVEFAAPTGDLQRCPFPRYLLKRHLRLVLDKLAEAA